MSKHLVKILIILFACQIFASQTSFAEFEYEQPINWSGNIYKIINNYTKLHANFSKEICRPGDHAKYQKLIKLYRGQGYYLPKFEDDIDRKAIIKNLHHFRKKLKFIDKQITRLKKLKVFPNYALLSEPIDVKVNSLLNLKKQHHHTLKSEDKLRILNESKIEMTQLKKIFEIFVDQLFFLKSYNFPNDFLENRKIYESFKGKPGSKNKMKANEVYFYRRLTEDGAYDPNLTRPDKYLRTALDTLYLEINGADGFISEDIRYDLEWLERQLKKSLRRGHKIHLSRLQEWRNRTKKNFDFYLQLIVPANKNKSKFLVQKENEAAYNLKNFVYKKQADTYAFWSKHTELDKALFSLETILVHEVGVLDGKLGLERTDVAKVVLNRMNDDFYNQLSPGQPITKFIPENIDTEEEKWLNVLFKIGEFSFTYHYIPAVAGIFCPDMSRRGKSIRGQNLKLALKAIKSHDGGFMAFRYFSRISMLGKIDMSSVWTGYDRLPEIPGLKANHQKKLISYYYGDRFQYLYSFVDEKNVAHDVVRIQDKTYSMRWSKGLPVFYDYRNPHLFAYFSKKI